MFGLKFIKVDPSEFILQMRAGKVIREGTGLSFFYFAPTTSLVKVPMSSTDIPFIFEEVTADFQQITVQGQLTYRVQDPKQLSQLMNFSLLSNSKDYASDDPSKLPLRLISLTQVLSRSSLNSLSLRSALGQSNSLVEAIYSELKSSQTTSSLGVEILGLSITSVRPTPETARALEAEAREQILRESDQAIYSRRNSAVEQERAIKENELNTEIAIESKRRQIKEAQMEAKIAIELRNKELVTAATLNARAEADAKAYAIATTMKALSEADPRTVQALANIGMDSGQLIAAAFKSLAEGTERIGQLNVTPDLLREIIDRSGSQ